MEPKGRVNESGLATKDGVESLLIGAYAMLDGISNGFGNPAHYFPMEFSSVQLGLWKYRRNRCP